jgi:hypothetical protein
MADELVVRTGPTPPVNVDALLMEIGRDDGRTIRVMVSGMTYRTKAGMDDSDLTARFWSALLIDRRSDIVEMLEVGEPDLVIVASDVQHAHQQASTDDEIPDLTIVDARF